nr:hypothetical protein CFP56_64107 [Quercus suber]
MQVGCCDVSCRSNGSAQLVASAALEAAPPSRGGGFAPIIVSVPFNGVDFVASSRCSIHITTIFTQGYGPYAELMMSVAPKAAIELWTLKFRQNSFQIDESRGLINDLADPEYSMVAGKGAIAVLIICIVASPPPPEGTRSEPDAGTVA